MGEKIRAQLASDFGMNLPERPNGVALGKLTNVYWLPAILLSDRAPSLWAGCLQFLRLYSFARNASTAFYVAAWYLVVVSSVHGVASEYAVRATSYLAGLLVVSGLLLFRYYYLYHSYYSRYLFRS